MNKRQIGTEKEQVAMQFLISKGYDIIELNYRCKPGEIDIIARDGKYLVFVEVKYRKSDKMGTPFEAVTVHKQNKIRQVATWYITQKHLNDVWIRYDVIGILGEDIKHIENAF